MHTQHSPPQPWRSIVWGQFRRKRLAVFGLACCLLILLLAICAPLLCMDSPFWITFLDPKTGETSTHFPWIRDLLFNRNAFENSIDVFFNLLLVALPFACFASLLKQPKIFLPLLAAFLLAFSALLISQPRQPHKDYTAIYAAPHAKTHALHLSQAFTGHDHTAPLQNLEANLPTAAFPPIAYSFRRADLDAVQAPWSATHPFGTDTRGRDVLARMLYGGRISLTIGIVAVALYITIGVLLGALAGYFRGWVDSVILRAIEVMLCFPSFVLILTLAAFVEEASIFYVMLIIGLTRWTGPARLTRGEFLRLGNQEFVAAAIASGIPQSRVILRHILPNALGPVLVNMTFGIAGAILTESALSFLNLGDPSAPSWGELLNIGRQSGSMSLILVPGFAIFLTISAFNLVGEGLRDALDPKLRQ